MFKLHLYYMRLFTDIFTYRQFLRQEPKFLHPT